MSEALTLAAVAESNTGTYVRRPLPIRNPKSGNVSSVGIGKYRLPDNMRTNTPTYPSEWTTSMTHRTRSVSTPPIVLCPPISSPSRPNYAPCDAPANGRSSVRPARAAGPHAGLYSKMDSNDADVRFPPVIWPVGCDNHGMLRDFEH